MKKVVLLILALGAILSLVSCACNHEWTDATCGSPKMCNLCGVTEGEPLSHEWADATCTDARVCILCNKTDGEATGHTWAEANCETAKTCTVCNMTAGEALGHQWNDATCKAPKTCSTCNKTEGEAAGHTWKEATYSAPKTCTACGATEGKPLTSTSNAGNTNKNNNGTSSTIITNSTKPETNGGKVFVQDADPDTGVSWDGKSPIVYTYEDGSTGTEKREGATYEQAPGMIATVITVPKTEFDPHCERCGKIMGNGLNGTCLSYWTGGDHNCPHCNVTIPEDTCHTCGE